MNASGGRAIVEADGLVALHVKNLGLILGTPSLAPHMVSGTHQE